MSQGTSLTSKIGRINNWRNGTILQRQAANRRVTVVVLDGGGIGVMPKHPLIDSGSSSIPNAAFMFHNEFGNFALPNLERLGLGNIATIAGVPAAEKPAGSYGVLTLDPNVMTDTITGHWALMGLETGQYPVNLNGFSNTFIKWLELKTGVTFIGGGKNISGTTILEECGAEAKNGRPILYTSSDSVLQVAYHVGFKGVDLDGWRTDLAEGFSVYERDVLAMYSLCAEIRQHLNESADPKHKFLRVIARPFVTDDTKKGQFTRISALRKDWALQVPGKSVLDQAKKAGFSTIGIGKICDIFSGQGLTETHPALTPPFPKHLKDDMEGIDFLIDVLKEPDSGITFVNLVDLDEKYGHRNDWEGYAKALMTIDSRLPEIQSAMGPNDILIFTGDHGNDPTRGLTSLYVQNGLDRSFFTERGTNHTREYVPFLAFGDPIRGGVNIGVHGMKDVADLIRSYLGLERK